jgi:hypothetical protein
LKKQVTIVEGVRGGFTRPENETHCDLLLGVVGESSVPSLTQTFQHRAS